MSKVCLLLLILNVVGMVSCMEQPPKQSRKQQGHQERLVKREVDLIKKNDHKIREYYRELAEVGLDGVTVMPIDKKVEYTDLAVELNFEILKRMGFQPVSDVVAQNALKKYYNIPQFRSIILCDLLLYIDVTFWYLSIDLGLFWGSWFLHRHKIPHPNPMGDMISTKKYCLFKEYFRVVCFICI